MIFLSTLLLLSCISFAQWIKTPRLAKDISAGKDGSAWIIGTDKQEGGYEIYKWTGSEWENIPGGGVKNCS